MLYFFIVSKYREKKSKYTGVISKGNKWTVKGNNIDPVVYNTEEEAAIWFNIVCFSLYGEIVYWNEIEDSVWDSFLGSPASRDDKTSKVSKKKSKYYGVFSEDRKGKKLYRAYIYLDGKKKNLGSRVNEDKAAQLVNNAIIKYSLDHSKLNKIPKK